MQAEQIRAIKIFYSYAHEDEMLCRQLKIHLNAIKQQSSVSERYDRDISAGKEWMREIDIHLNTADIILLLISPDFLNSDYCNSREMKRALERHEAREARVIPIILRPVYWQDAPFSKLQVLPIDGKPVESAYWHNRDEAFLDVARGIRTVIKELSAKSKDQWLKEGRNYYRLGHYEEALDAYGQAIRLDTIWAPAYHCRGLALSGLQRYEEALAAYEQTIQLNPHYAYPYNGKSFALCQLQRYEEALASSERAIQLAPGFDLAYYNKGRALEHLGRIEEAQQAYEKARQLSDYGTCTTG